MAWILSLLILAAQIAPASAGPAGADAEEALVASFFPSEIREESARYGVSPGESAWSIATPGGERRLVAVYTNGFRARVRLIAPESPARLLDEHEAYSMHGIFPKVILGQVIPDSAPEVIVRMSSAKGGQLDWIFSIEADRLRVVGPMRANSDGMTAVVDASYRDIDGDGVLEIFSETGRFGEEGGPQEIGPQMYRLDEEGTIKAVPIAYYSVFYRNLGAPSAETEHFESGETSGTLVIYNALPDCKPVASAHIRLNGKTIVQPRDFPRSAVSRIPVQLSAPEVGVRSGKPTSRSESRVLWELMAAA